MELAEHVARLASVGERMLAREERAERARYAAELNTRWGGNRPQQAGIIMFLKAIPGLAARFDRTVPSEFVAQTDDGELTIACPCGEAPTVAAGALASCACGRWFLHDGRDVHVARFADESASKPGDEAGADAALQTP